MLELGADPNPLNHSGFPPLIAALSCSRTQPGSPARSDVIAIMALLFEYGVDPNQRGINDWTALHMAVAERNLAAVRLLLASGADPLARTRIDEYESPREMAAAAGLTEIGEILSEAERRART